jgi:hypothetical protein
MHVRTDDRVPTVANGGNITGRSGFDSVKPSERWSSTSSGGPLVGIGGRVDEVIEMRNMIVSNNFRLQDLGK